MNLRVLAASGDSVGHVNHALVILNALAARHNLVGGIVLPSDSKFRSYIVKYGYRTFGVGETLGISRALEISDVFRRPGRLIVINLRAIYESWLLINQFRPNLVVGTGGRGSFPTTFVAAVRAIPCVTVPHYVPMRTNRILSYFVDRTCVVDNSDYSRFPKFIHKRLRITGTPLRKEAFIRIPLWEAKEHLLLDPGADVVTFVGYSRGSPMFSDLIQKIILRFENSGENVQFVVQHGEFPLYELGESRRRNRVLAKSFFNNILDVFSASDIVVSAGGETTLLELCAKGVPSICISLSDTPIGNHVFVLAQHLHDKGATIFIPPSQLSAESLEKTISLLLSDKARRKRMTNSALAIPNPYSTENVVHVIEELLINKQQGGRALYFLEGKRVKTGG
jgi:UDP-N-acetylglucosamine--N-acetylmuramyl-(pentapeptide) pyrophosphoryl-undecaprenol N-acetylglucosamine transferase